MSYSAISSQISKPSILALLIAVREYGYAPFLSYFYTIRQVGSKFSKSHTLSHVARRWRIDHTVPLVSALLHLALELTGVQRLQQLKAAKKFGRDTHDRTIVVELATVVWSRENRNEDTILEELVAILNNHVSAADEVEVVASKELSDDLLSKRIANTTFAALPIVLLLGRVRPEEIVEETEVGNISWASNLADVIHVTESRRQTTVNTEDLAGDDCCDWKLRKR